MPKRAAEDHSSLVLTLAVPGLGLTSALVVLITSRDGAVPLTEVESWQQNFLHTQPVLLGFMAVTL